MSAEDNSSDCSTAWVVDHLQAARSWLIPRLEAMLGRDGSADDVAQEASMRALSESPKGCFDAWLWVAARNLAIDWLRKRGREVTNADELLECAIATPRREALRDSIQLRQVLAVLADLSEGQRVCLKLHYFDDLSYEEIASKLHLPVRAVRAHIQNGRLQFRRRWTDRRGGGKAV
jgi:RNA polymerase sigma factor (sigma-70 family)